MAWKEESQFCPDGKDWNGGGKFWPDLNGLNRQMSVLPAWNGLECQKSILALLEWLRIEEVGFGMTGMAWKERSRFWSFQNSLEWRNSFTDCLQWHKLILT
jgi:hypothetical protein